MSPLENGGVCMIALLADKVVKSKWLTWAKSGFEPSRGWDSPHFQSHALR
jgi:hypothetical protein